MDDSSHIELLERAVNEIDALQAIYGCDDEEDGGSSSSNNKENGESTGSYFAVVSQHELEMARQIISTENEPESSDIDQKAIPQLEIEIKLNIMSTACILRCKLPPGYPEIPLTASLVSIARSNRSQRDEISNVLNETAESLRGCESVMSLVDTLQQDLAPTFLEETERKETEQQQQQQQTLNNAATESTRIGRRWIWVHHITNTERRKSILREARALKLGGYLKWGYPGIVVIEGSVEACNEFVMWVKGNKSRPGGFGRNWGHHVRGEIDFDGGHSSTTSTSGHRRLLSNFEELEDLAELGSLCKNYGLESEFLEYVMQHK